MSSTAYHFAIDRDEAKRLFSSRQPEQLRVLVHQWIQSDSVNDRCGVLPSPTDWPALDQCLSRDERAADPPSPLPLTFLGGQPLAKTDDLTVVLLRPDLVPVVAAALGEVGSDQIAERLKSAGAIDETTARQLCRHFESLQSFFTSAASRRDAIVFARLDSIGG